jgi:hypothetical protein
LKRWKLVWMQWAVSLIRDMTIIFATICIRKTRMTGEILIKNLFVQTLWKIEQMTICMKSCHASNYSYVLFPLHFTVKYCIE